MKKLIFIFLCAASLAVAAAGYATMASRADRSFQWKEWSSAAAMYELMLRERPDDASLYVHAIVASQMIPDSAAAVDLVERAMSHDMGLDSVLAGVRRLDFSIGEGDRYGRFLYTLRNAMPWMARGLDNQLLLYYRFRNDGPNIEKYAKVMLAGLPDSEEYLSQLAYAYMLQDKMADACSLWQRILTINPRNYEALLYLGNYLVNSGNTARGDSLLRQANDIRTTPYVTDKITNP